LTPAGETAKRIGRGTLKPGNWLQLFQFGIVGVSGYLINLAVFAVVNNGLGIHYIAAAIVAFCVAVTNNFWWNRRWTFRARGGHAGFQAARFFTVSVAAFLFAALVLELLVSVAELPDLPSQAIAVVVATPLNFIGNKMWSFRIELSRD
jgi:putative flippase GtrA